MNCFTGIGNIVKDIEARVTTNGKSVVRNTIAIKRNRKNNEGKYESDFINFTAFGVNAELIAKYFHKGDKIGIYGKIETGSYKDKNGNTVYTTDLMVESIEFLNPKSKESKESTSITREELEVEVSGMELPF